LKERDERQAAAEQKRTKEEQGCKSKEQEIERNRKKR
jgi:hypothetical protein